MKRKEGTYWVMYLCEWMAAQFICEKIIGKPYWFLPGYNNKFRDHDFEEINENRILPPNE